MAIIGTIISQEISEPLFFFFFLWISRLNSVISQSERSAVSGSREWDLITQTPVNAVIMICYKSIGTTDVMFSPSERTPSVYSVTHKNQLGISVGFQPDYVNSDSSLQGKSIWFPAGYDEVINLLSQPFVWCFQKVWTEIFIPFPHSRPKQASESFRLGLV